MRTHRKRQRAKLSPFIATPQTSLSPRDSWATHFEVCDPQGRKHEVDLGYPAEPSPGNLVHVLVPMEEGIVRGVEAFSDEKAAQQAEQDWLAERDLMDAKKREQSSDWGTGIAIWECPLNT